MKLLGHLNQSSSAVISYSDVYFLLFYKIKLLIFLSFVTKLEDVIAKRKNSPTNA